MTASGPNEATAISRLVAADEVWRASATSHRENATQRLSAMADAYRAGASLAAIGAAVGVSHSAVHKAMTRAGLSPKDLRTMRDASASRSGLDPAAIRGRR